MGSSGTGDAGLLTATTPGLRGKAPWASPLVAALLAGLLLAPQGAGEGGELPESDSQPPPSHSVELVEDSPCCPKQMVVEVEGAGDEARPRQLRLSARIDDVERLVPVVGDRLLVAGTMRYGGEAIVLADLREMKQEQVLWTHGWTLSPSTRFLVYRTHHPRMVPPGGRRSILLLWDLTKPPSENIPGEAEEWPTPNLGRVIFPEENLERGSYDVRIAPDWGLSSEFLWSEDGRRLVFLATEFLDEQMEERECSIVRIDLADDGSVTALEREPLLPALVAFRGEPRPGAVPPDRSLCFYAPELSWLESAPGEPPRVLARVDQLSAADLGAALAITVP